MLALVAAPNTSAKVELREVENPAPAANEAIVETRAISLNRGEVRSLSAAKDGDRKGWDVAGIVARAAADGSGPMEGTRVVGLVRTTAWAQQVAVPTSRLAALPDGVSFAAASTLPVAGLTALWALRMGGLLLGKRVLVTGASGGVGRFAVQLAALSGAHVTAQVGSQERGAGLSEIGADEVVISYDEWNSTFDLIVESNGGPYLAAALSRVTPGGTVVTFGNSSREETIFDASSFYSRGGARLIGLQVFGEVDRSGLGSRDLGYMAELMAAGKLDPQIELEQSWRNPEPAMEALLGRRVRGKAVLHVD